MPRLLPVALALALTGLAPGQQAPVAPRRGVELVLGGGLFADGSARMGWVPCDVLVTNHGLARAVEVTLRAHAWSWRQRVELSPGQTRRLWFLLPLSRGQWPIDAQAYELSDGDVRGTQLAATRTQLDVRDRSRGWGGALRVLYVRDEHEQDGQDPPIQWVQDWAGTARGRFRRDPAEIGQRAVRALPANPLAYDGMDLVVLHDVDCGQLERPQVDALLAWVATGGQVLLIPGSERAWFQQEPLAALLGGRRFQPRSLRSLPELEQAYGARLRGAPAAQLFLPDGWAPAEALQPVGSSAAGGWPVGSLPGEKHDGLRDGGSPWLPLAHALRYGVGQVHVLAFDPTSAAFRHWSGRGPLFRSLLDWTGAAQSPRWRMRFDDEEDPLQRGRLLGHLDSRSRPEPLFVVSTVLLYILCVGPLNYWLLGRRGQRHRLVLTVPGLALAFTLVVFAGGYVTGGLRSVSWRIDLVRGGLGLRWAWERSAASVRSALDPAHHVQLGPGLTGGRVYTQFDYTQRYDQAYGLAEDGLHFDVQLERWELAYAQGLRIRDLGAGVSVVGGAGAPTLRNDSPLALGPGLYFGDDPTRPWVTPALAPGEAAALARQLDPLPVPPTLPPTYQRKDVVACLIPDAPEAQALAQALLDASSVQPPQGPGAAHALFALLEEPPSTLVIDGRDPDRRVSVLVLQGARP